MASSDTARPTKARLEACSQLSTLCGLFDKATAPSCVGVLAIRLSLWEKASPEYPVILAAGVASALLPSSAILGRPEISAVDTKYYTLPPSRGRHQLRNKYAPIAKTAFGFGTPTNLRCVSGLSAALDAQVAALRESSAGALVVVFFPTEPSLSALHSVCGWRPPTDFDIVDLQATSTHWLRLLQPPSLGNMLARARLDPERTTHNAGNAAAALLPLLLRLLQTMHRHSTSQSTTGGLSPNSELHFECCFWAAELASLARAESPCSSSCDACEGYDSDNSSCNPYH